MTIDLRAGWLITGRVRNVLPSAKSRCRGQASMTTHLCYDGGYPHNGRNGSRVQNAVADASHVGGHAVDAVTVDAAQIGLYERAGDDGGIRF